MKNTLLTLSALVLGLAVQNATAQSQELSATLRAVRSVSQNCTQAFRGYELILKNLEAGKKVEQAKIVAVSAKIASCGNAAAVVIEGADSALTNIESASQASKKGKGRAVMTAAFVGDASAEADASIILPDVGPSVDE